MIPPLTSSTWRRFDLSCVAAVFLFAGCLNSPTVSRTVYEDPTILVQLDGPALQEEISGGPTRPVAELTAADLASVLRSVMIQPEIGFASYWILRNEPQLKPAFPESDADLLASHLHDALTNARPHETAVFSLRRTRGDGIPLVTTGALILRGDQLILILTNAGRAATTQWRLDAARETPLRMIGAPDFHFVAGPSQTVLAAKDLPKTVDIGSAPVLSINYSAWHTGALAPGRSPSPSPVAPTMPAATIEEKLRQLKIWHEQGLIADDEYRSKRQELLKTF